MKVNNLFFITVLGLIAIGSGASAEECANQIKSEWQQSSRELRQQYRSMDPELKFESQNFPKVFLAKQGGHKEAVYTLHGFMGSPAEMRFIAKGASNIDLDVFSDLILGFGASAYIANKYHREQWYAWMEARLLRLANCYQKIHLVGFSTGGLLIHRFLYEHSAISSKFSVVLISPFYDPDSGYLRLIGSSVGNIPAGIPLKPAYQLSKHPDLKALLLEPRNYLQVIPLTAANQVFELGKEQMEQQRRNPFTIWSKLKLFLSSGDRVLRVDSSLQMVKNFRDSQVKIYPEGVPHHIMVRSVSPVAKEMTEEIIEFIKKERGH